MYRCIDVSMVGRYAPLGLQKSHKPLGLTSNDGCLSS